MSKRMYVSALVVCLTGLIVAVAQDPGWNPISLKHRPSDVGPGYVGYSEAIRRAANITQDPTVTQMAYARGLNVLNLTWEDTGRYKGSAVGPNISDMTIQVGLEDPATRQFQVTCMPVIRYPNFSDKTCDLDPRDFTLLVGNEDGRTLKRISLHDFLANPTAFLSKPGSWLGKDRSLLAPRDSKVLVSAQACFLPVPQQGKATFNPVLFNYQSVSGDPAVLTVLATHQGTSVTVIDNKRDAFREGSAWGQRLFFNKNGMRASLTGERMSDYKNTHGTAGTPKDNKQSSGLNMALLIQIPLKQKYEMRFKDGGGFGGGGFGAPGAAMETKARRGSDVEAAVLGHGQIEGPFTEIDNLNIQRDDRYPVRVTVQFYKATATGEVNEADLDQIKREIDGVYANSDSVGSLVVEGRTGRVTEYDGLKVQPRDWWQQFWHRHEQNTGDSREEAVAKLRKLLGANFMHRPVTELYLRDLLRH